MPVEAGQQLLHYRLIERIGEGGMGVVWKATDTTLDRDVAIKILPDAFTGDKDRLARFQREAKLLASLNHANIATVHSVHEVDGLRFLAMEFVGGEDLAQRLARGPIPIDEALEIAVQITEALDVAHEAGVIHRDLKPANIKITPGGVVKVLDFGLAKALEPDTVSRSVDTRPSMSPTLTAAGTVAGVILGTASYMSPEQARGKPVDKRTDIWAFGCVLYEMMTGARPFGGETVPDTLAAVLKEEPDWDTLPAGLHRRVRELLRRCVAKRAQDRLRDIGDARWEIARSRDEESSPEATLPPPVARLHVGRLALTVAVAAIAGVVFGWWLFAKGSTSERSAPVARLSIALPDQAGLSFGHWPASLLGISSDGTWIAYRGRHLGEATLHLRRLDSLHVTPVPDADGFQPFFSPDGEWVAFFDGAGNLKKMNLAAGQPTTLARGLVGSEWSFGSWGDDGVIVFSEWEGPLYTIPADGGTPAALTRPAENEVHGFPVVLPGSRHVLYVATPDWREEIRLHDRKTGEETTILENAGHPHYLASGHLLFARDGVPMVAPFDLERLTLTGSAVPAPLPTRVDTVQAGNGRPQLAVSQNGTLVFAAASPDFMRESTFVWVDREGNIEEVATLPLRRPWIDLAPDGRRVVVTDMQSGEMIVQVLDLERLNLNTLSRNRQLHLYGVTWGPSDSAVYAHAEEGAIRVLETVLGQDTPTELLADRDTRFLVPSSVSPDGETLALMRYDKVSAGDIWMLGLEGDDAGSMHPFSTEPAHEHSPVFSPDGRWVAYVSGPDLYARRFPQGNDRTLIAQDAWSPRWSSDGRELFYVEDAKLGLRVVSVAAATGPRLDLGYPRPLFEGAYRRGSDEGRAYAVAPDGSRFLMMRYDNDEDTADELTVVLNWFEELKRLAPEES